MTSTARSARRNKMTIIRLLVLELSLSTLLFSQSATTATSGSAVHISGSISQCGKIVPGVFVRFFEGNAQHEVKANDAGVYEVDLPFGIWTATTDISGSSPTASAIAKQTLSRPRHFALSAPGRLFLDLQIRPPVICDIATRPGEESGRDAVCWGEEFFPVPSSDGVPLEVDLFGLVLVTDHDACSFNHPRKEHREFATFNLLSVHADRVVYHPSERILEASGNVVIEDESGERRQGAARFEIGDGQARELR